MGFQSSGSRLAAGGWRLAAGEPAVTLHVSAIIAAVKKLRVGVIYGGRSGEHEVSVASAAAIFKHLDRTRYEAVPIRIEKDGRWVLADKAPLALSASDVIEQGRTHATRLPRPGRDTLLVSHPGEDTLVTIERRIDREAGPEADSAVVTGLGLDVVFPVLHGPYGEDGTVQGLLELAAVPYVGSGVLASAAGMDKVAMKALFVAHGLPIAPYVAATHFEWTRDRQAVAARVEALGLPVFVKPANLGSSVGITKVHHAGELAAALELAAAHDRRLVVEQGIDARELEVSVLGNDDPIASAISEIEPTHEFYDYAAKYIDEDGATFTLPAQIPPETADEVRDLAIRAYKAIDCAGMARVDFFLERGTGRLLLNEINTIPGFTTISQYPKMWEASGLPFDQLVTRLIELAIERHADKRNLL
jgi:D-alanine-D-alanine ligase